MTSLEGSFFQLMNEKSDYGGKFSHLLHEKLKVWLKKIPKKLRVHARLLGNS